MKCKRKAMKCKGFTLIEAVIVIGIMAVLVVMAAPDLLNVMSDAKERADVASGRVIYEACVQVDMNSGTELKDGTININNDKNVIELLTVVPECNNAENFYYKYDSKTGDLAILAGDKEVYPENKLGDAR